MRVSKGVLCLAAMAAGLGTLGTLGSLRAEAAVLCVSSSGASGCWPGIGAAVAAAAPGDVIKVGSGTYYESVYITKAVSITTENAIVDATGLGRGFYVDGLSSPGLASVNIAGFTIRNANFEGVLVLNASNVSVGNNTVINNNQSLTASATCPGLEGFETNEQSDCGEGIHLLGADHSIVTNNTITGNSGGILVSDDTAAAHHNLITLNRVALNPYACGITLASHAPYVGQQSYGVFNNMVYGNRSSQNGLANGGGAGAGIYASVPFAKSYSNVIVDNYLSQNGLPGIAMHAHAPFQLLNDNMLVANTLVSNGADAEDAYTPAPTGINIYSLTPVTGNMISGNTMQGESIDVAVKVPALVSVKYNQLDGNGLGVMNLGVGAVDATENWWSCPSGPTISGSCSLWSGLNLEYGSWLTTPIPGQPSF